MYIVSCRIFVWCLLCYIICKKKHPKPKLYFHLFPWAREIHKIINTYIEMLPRIKTLWIDKSYTRTVTLVSNFVEILFDMMWNLTAWRCMSGSVQCVLKSIKEWIITMRWSTELSSICALSVVAFLCMFTLLVPSFAGVHLIFCVEVLY
jgi:hypothetical protein